MLFWLALVSQLVLKYLQLYATSGLFNQLPINEMIAKLIHTILKIKYSDKCLINGYKSYIYLMEKN